MKILAVDDDISILDVIRIILEDEHYEVLTLDNGNDIMETLKLHSPDLILLDVMLGGLDGRDICRALKENEAYKNIPVVMLSASHNLKNVKLLPGAPDNFVAKPFDIDHLLEIIREQLAA